jgi:hypothetical protein
MEQTAISLPWWFNLLVALCAGIVVVSTLAWKIAKPHIEKYVLQITEPLKKRIEINSLDIADLGTKKLSDHSRISVLERQNKAMLKAQLVMLLHARDNNHTGEMDKVIKELQEEVINS